MLEPEPEELLGAVAAFEVGGGCSLPAGRVPRPLGYPDESIIPEEKTTVRKAQVPPSLFPRLSLSQLLTEVAAAIVGCEVGRKKALPCLM